MKHILIPTDFTIRSLQTVQAVADHFNGEPIRITLFHLLDMPSGIGDLLFRTTKNIKENIISSDFKTAYQVIANKYQSTISQMKIEFGQGSTAAYLSNVFEGLNVDAVFIPANSEFTLANSNSINPLPLIYKTKYKIIEMPVTTLANRQSTSLADLVAATR
jgi:aryl-phospho-beta-D-glucosidase BglC (GH1 family)